MPMQKLFILNDRLNVILFSFKTFKIFILQAVDVFEQNSSLGSGHFTQCSVMLLDVPPSI